MRKFVLSIVIIVFGFSIAVIQGFKKINPSAPVIFPVQTLREPLFGSATMTIKKSDLSSFFGKYPDLKKYQADVTVLYKKRNYASIWYDKKGLIEFANLLYSKANQLEDEGLKSSVAYKDKMDGIFDGESTKKLSKTDKELLLSSLFVYYAEKVFKGIDTEKITELGWFLPRKNLSYAMLLDSLLVDANLLNKNEDQQFGQYYRLREALRKYRKIDQNGGWSTIDMNPFVKYFQPNDSSKTIRQIRTRLFVTGDLKTDSKSNWYDEDLMAGILNYKKRNGIKPNYMITREHVQNMNVPIAERIKTIMVNMERCRWIPPELTKANEYIIINIPSFKLIYRRNGKKELESNVFVGKSMTETVIFSGAISYIVFSPYWIVPKSIIENELKQAIARDPNYLASHNMEWNNGGVRQKPGIRNSMGLIKFMFPNTNNIYLHDTPVKSLFEYEVRAFSHGCINMVKAKELAILLLRDEPEWNEERIHAAMYGGVETTHVLKRRVPVHIGYFTAWVDDAGIINFYKDIYDRDYRLADMLFSGDFK
jgi:murein L,D-transpeptidase YcbB/YkuD